ncbi:MAG: acetate uptake transporter [Candidatus Coatesbacteria bacterium]|nr:acetate uptake transporter [Candidatus Coatesbacteria bacterium]
MDSRLANPAPLGLMGFGMTTVLLNFHNAGFSPLDSMILAMGMFYGGLAQIIAGIMEFKKGNTFGLTAFCSYGLFWMSLVVLLIAPKVGIWSSAPTDGAMAAYLFVWGLFTFGMFIATKKGPFALRFVFGTLFILFWLLAAGDATGAAWLKKVAGWEGIICGSSAIYLAMAQIINEHYGKVVVPIG